VEPEPFTHNEKLPQNVIVDLGFVASLSAGCLIELVHHREIRVLGPLREEQAANLEVPRVAGLDDISQVRSSGLRRPVVSRERPGYLLELLVRNYALSSELLIVIVFELQSKFPSSGEPGKDTANDCAHEATQDADEKLHSCPCLVP
jgi:hypothetical protein